MLPHVHEVKTGLIRVDADEVTYPLHVILRFELEKDLIEGRLESPDLPEAWDAKMSEYLGLSTLDNSKDGPMQDVHWPGGAFGYFPTYTLGAMMAAQHWAALEKDHPSAATTCATAASSRSTTGAATRSGRRARASRRRSCWNAPPARSSTRRISPII